MRRVIVVYLLMTFGLTASAQNLQEKKWNKMEQEIIKPITDIFSGVDERNWQKIENALAEKVLTDYTSLNGGKPLLQTPTEVTAAWASFLPGFDRTHHEVTNFKITTKGNVATVHYDGMADHFLEKEVWGVS